MKKFEHALLRLKEQLKLPTDKEVGELLGLQEKAFNARKRRDSFPEKDLRALAQQRPELGIDVLYVLTGERNPITALRLGAEITQQHLNQQQQSMRQAIEHIQSGGALPDVMPAVQSSSAPAILRSPPGSNLQAASLTADEALLLERYRASPLVLQEAALRVLDVKKE